MLYYAGALKAPMRATRPCLPCYDLPLRDSAAWGCLVVLAGRSGAEDRKYFLDLPGVLRQIMP